MEDERIVELFWARDEDAIKETELKYNDLCHYIAKNFLALREDREECVNDALLALWNSIPPERPKSLRAYLSSIVRNIAISRTRASNAWKRGGQVQIVNEEFLSTVDDGTDLASYYESRRAGEVINKLLRKISRDDRRIFVMRYWFDLSYAQIASHTGFGESKIKNSLSRTRRKLAEELGKEGITL
ncbi:MAG: sigma-70 family RNA polymerase sigma factor [Clostridia bacterium]|nr:sigma-70 family RNA polymerase sigma factor [Clostridia bacterium]